MEDQPLVVASFLKNSKRKALDSSNAQLMSAEGILRSNGPDSSDGSGIGDADDPRKSENWKIQKKRGFQRDREDKMKQVKQSKTSKRNS